MWKIARRKLDQLDSVTELQELTIPPGNKLEALHREMIRIPTHRQPTHPFAAERKLTEGAEKVFVNGDSFIPNARVLAPVFKARQFAPVEG